VITRRYGQVVAGDVDYEAKTNVSLTA